MDAVDRGTLLRIETILFSKRSFGFASFFCRPAPVLRLSTIEERQIVLRRPQGNAGVRRKSRQ